MEWSKPLAPVILVAHNCRTFDSCRLVKSVCSADMLDEFQNVVNGFADEYLDMKETLRKKRNKHKKKQIKSAGIAPCQNLVATQTARPKLTALTIQMSSHAGTSGGTNMAAAMATGSLLSLRMISPIWTVKTGRARNTIVGQTCDGFNVLNKQVSAGEKQSLAPGDDYETEFKAAIDSIAKFF